MNVRTKTLIALYQLFPFSLKGDCILDDSSPACEISCLINFYGRIDLLEGILYSLVDQDLAKERYEVVLLEDRGGTHEGRNTAERFQTMLTIKYVSLSEQYGKMGHSRNVALSHAKGKYVLFLDDDTVILQRDFLTALIEEFRTSDADAVIPHGSASYALLKGKYDFHAPYFPTNRCMAYRREVLKTLGGFVDDIVGQEDVEFVIRYIAGGRRFHQAGRLTYLHPPLLATTYNKAAAVGLSFARLRKRYPLLVWIMLLINGARYVPLLFFPVSTKWRMQGRFSAGFALGIFYAAMNKKVSYG